MTATARHLYDADTNNFIGVATAEQITASDEAAENGEFGAIILIDEDGDVVDPSERTATGTYRKVYVEAGE